VFSRRATGSGLAADLVDGDIRDHSAVRSAAQRCDAVCHLAALVRIWLPRPSEFDEVNVGGLQNVLSAVRDLGISRLLYTSSFIALPPTGTAAPLTANDYQRTKVAALRVARAAATDGMPLICVFPGVVYGPGIHTEGNLLGNLFRDHLAGRLPGLVGADRRWSYAYVEDVADGHVAALERGRVGGEYRLCGENVAQMRPFELLRELTGRALPRRIPFWMASAIGAVEELGARLVSRPPRVTRGVVDIFRHEWAFDSDLAIRELGYRITPLRDGVTETLKELVTSRSTRMLRASDTSVGPS
jgi:farnesol dehydrogenase